MENYSWITFKVDFRKVPFQTWVSLGKCVSKCQHIKQVPLLPEVRDELLMVYLVKGVQATTAIEGNTLSEEQVRAAVAGELEIEKSREYQKQEVVNVIEACNEIMGNLAKGNDDTITIERLCRLNKNVLRDVPLPEHVEGGKLRSYRVGVGTYRAPSAKDVAELLEKFCSWFSNELKNKDEQFDEIGFAILKAIIAHIYIAWIHPFGDGNGRLARLIEFATLLSSGVPSPAAHLLSNHYNATRMEYYRQLDYASKTGDIVRFFEYAIQGLHDGLENVIDYIIAQIRYISWEHYVYDQFRQMPRSEILKRQRDVVIELSQQGRGVTYDELFAITAHIYLKAGKKRGTFTRDINNLLKIKFICEDKGKLIANTSLIAERLPFSV